MRLRLGQLVVVQTTLLQCVDGASAEQLGVRPQRGLVRRDQVRFQRVVVAQLNGVLENRFVGQTQTKR